MTDKEAWIATVDADEVRRVLEDMEQLPWGASGTWGIAQGRDGRHNSTARPIPIKSAVLSLEASDVDAIVQPGAKRLIADEEAGSRDGGASLATVEAGGVRQVLDNAERLPSAVQRAGCLTEKSSASQAALLVQPTATETSGGVQPTSRLLPTSLESLVRPFWMPKTSPAKSKPAVDARESTWMPKEAAAGTELMVAGLIERIGGELERVNLQVNNPGCDKGDSRPRVVWMHHDVNQEWVQWCREKELVDTVDCFVFVSHWQREQYLNAFGLPPQRCVVLRHALDLNPEMRRWEAEPIWRCAFTSTPFRGLSVLLDAWERLSPANAELHIWSSMKLYLGDDGPYEHLYARARSMPQVFYHGIMPNSELRAALRKMHFLVYPCTFRETACLAVIEAMAAGCRVIVPSLGALPETTGGYARVYSPDPDDARHAADFAEVLANEIARPWAGEPELSLEQQRHCAAVYDWRRRTEEWRRLIDSVADRAGRREPPMDAASTSMTTFITGKGRSDVVAAARALTKGGIFVEVGTFKGEFAEVLCSQCEPAQLYCVDPYLHYADYRDTINSLERLEEICAQAHARLARFGTRVKFIKALSADAVTQFADHSLDFVYLDGNHAFRFVDQDLRLWYPKLRPGGLMCGDDAFDTDDRLRNADGDVEIVWLRNAEGTVVSGGHYGVLKAVRRFCEQRSIEFLLSGPQFLFQKALSE